MKLKIILGSTRDSRFGIQPAEWLLKESKSFEYFETELLDLKDYSLPLVGEDTENNEFLNKWKEKLNEADAFIIITPEYNHSFSGVLKNAIDLVKDEWSKKPVSFLSYGGQSGGIRAVEQLIQVFVELEMAPQRYNIHINNLWSHLDENGRFQPNPFEKNLEPMFNNLEWWAKALKENR